MQREFLQEKSLTMLGGNAEKSINVDLSAKSRIVPHSAAADLFGINDLYVEERNACENYRMIFTVNPICSNVLYNAITEPVFQEGSYSALSLVETTVSKSNTNIFPNGTMNQSGNSAGNRVVDQIGAVRDTEYSHEKIGGFVYHCGYDIFNNHLLRSDEFEHIRMEGSSTPKNENVFNTIFDYAIDYNGKVVNRIIGESEGPLPNLKSNRADIRTYSIDSTKTFDMAFYEGMRTVDGWYGFYNSGYIEIPNGKLGGDDIFLNKVINNETRCEFIDLYPDRTLFSFIPKVNRYRKRLERNWDCSIVYPYKSDTDAFNMIMTGVIEADYPSIEDNRKPNAVKVMKTVVTHNNVGDEMIEMHSLLRHTLSPRDTVRLFYAEIDGAGETGYGPIQRYSLPVEVVSVGDDMGKNVERYFTVRFSDINSFCDIDDDGNIVSRFTNGAKLMFFYRKVENGCDDRYYFRKFRKLKNYDYVECTSDNTDSAEWAEIETNAVVGTKEPTIATPDTPKYIKINGTYIKKIERPLNYTQNKIAYATNIYGDRVAQVIFNDDICTTGLKDNLGRPLTSVYFSVFKANRGHKEWYEENNLTADTVEYSHCFGDVTSGLDLPADYDINDYNVRKLHNIFTGDCENNSYKNGLGIIMEGAPESKNGGRPPLPLESGITEEDYDEFYGDIVEFNRTNFTETVIEKVYHRFNTAQRECLKNDKYFDIHYDDLIGDIYDVKNIS